MIHRRFDSIATRSLLCLLFVLACARTLLERDAAPTREAIQEAISGNLCRCTGYTKIVDAIEDAAEAMRGEAVRR